MSNYDILEQYADAPQVIATCANDGIVDGVNPVDGRSRPPPGTFMFNDVTAAMFKEWKVIKKNKYGKKQNRMLGIDLHKVYNSKVGERQVISRTNTKVVSGAYYHCLIGSIRALNITFYERLSAQCLVSRGFAFCQSQLIFKFITMDLKI